MKLKTPLICALVVVLSIGSAFAQGGGGGQGRGGRGGGGIAGLLRNSAIQTELQLTDDQKTKIQALGEEVRASMQNNGGTPPDPAEMRSRMAEVNKKYEAILTPDQVKRVHEIQLQQEGMRAVLRSEIADQLGLSDDQKAKIKTLNGTYTEANRSIGEKVQAGTLDRQAAGQERQKNGQTLTDEIQKVLTQPQQDKLKEMGGKPFDLTLLRGRRGGGGL